MFWGLVLRANKRYSQTVTKTFHLSQATLDVTSTSGDGDVQVVLASENENYILCHLSKKKNVLQVPLDLVFSEGDDIAFSCVGGVVHLTGYLVPNDDFEGFGGEEGVDEEEEEDELTENSPPKKLSKSQEALKKLLEAEHGDVSDEDDSDIDENDLLDGDDSDNDDEEAEGEDDDDDEEVDEDEEDEDEEDDEEDEVVEPVAKKQKQQNGVAAQVNGKAPKAEKAAAPVAAAQPPKAKTLTGGVKVEDIRPGKGAEAKPGKTVQVYYEGRLQSNNKVFDSSKTGKGFSFRLGQGEVIRGWDVGVAGMKIGSKRRIVCPPAMAYGAKGAPPAIPSNATLVFEVELRGIK